VLRNGSFGPLRYMERPEKPRLTPREEAVVELVGRGLTNAEIARTLGLSPWTVKRHVARVLAKTGARRRVDLAVRHARQMEEERPSDEDA
jgi:DNA-binding CsgD family transcriptional regulator